MIRTTAHTLEFATDAKRQRLDLLRIEYGRVVNAFILLYWKMSERPSMTKAVHYKQIDSWMTARGKQIAGNQALCILKSLEKKDRDNTYKAYQKAFARAKSKNRNIFGILDSKWSVWSKGKKFRHRVKMPVFNGMTMDLSDNVAEIQKSEGAVKFDLWIQLKKIFGNRVKIDLPTKNHERDRRFENLGWQRKKSVKIRKNHKGKYLVDTFWFKEDPEPKLQSKVLGVDIGINKLLTTSDGAAYGIDLKSKINKLNNRKQDSKNWHQTRKEIKDYIGKSTNEFFKENNDVDAIAMENIVGITQNTKGRVNKATRKLLGYWNINLLYRRMQDKAEVNRVYLAFVDPAYTSQMCNSCLAVDKKSRKGVRYKCTTCDHEDDSDINGAKNILQKFLDEPHIVARGAKSES